jgi:hypothetical protein
MVAADDRLLTSRKLPMVVRLSLVVSEPQGGFYTPQEDFFDVQAAEQCLDLPLCTCQEG